MTTPTNTTAPALPDDMVERATEALIQSYCRASGAPLSTVGDELYQLRRAEAVAALTAVGVPELLAAFPFCERHTPNGGKRSRCLICSLETLSRALSRIDYACGAPNAMNVSDYDVHCDESAVVQRVVERLAEVERLRAQLVEEEQCKQWLQKQCDSADDEAVSLRAELATAERERDEAREEVQRRDRLDEVELDGIAAALEGQSADSCSLSDPAERETWLLGYNGEAELLRLRRERDEARAALADCVKALEIVEQRGERLNPPTLENARRVLGKEE